MTQKFSIGTWLCRILLACNVLAVLVYLTAAYAGYVHPSKSGLIAMIGLGYWIALIPVLLFIPVWLIFRVRYSLVSVAALLLTIPQLLTLSPLHFGGGDHNFRLMTYNALGLIFTQEGSPTTTVDEILNYDPDFVCLQESFPENRVKEKYGDQWKEVAEKYPYRNLWAGEYLGFLSKTPTEVVEVGKDEHLTYYALYRTEIGDRKAYFFNVHLQSIGLNDGDKQLYRNITDIEDNRLSKLRGVRSRLMSKLRTAFVRRTAQAETIKAKIDSIRTAVPDATVFVCGDFNDTPYSYSYRTIRGNLRDAYADGAFGPTITYNADRFYFHIDQVFNTPDLKAVNTEVGDSKASDHYPVIVDYYLPNLNK